MDLCEGQTISGDKVSLLCEEAETFLQQEVENWVQKEARRPCNFFQHIHEYKSV